MTYKEQIKAIIKQYADKGKKMYSETLNSKGSHYNAGFWDGYECCAKGLLRELEDMQEEFNITGIGSKHATGKLKEVIDNVSEEGLEEARKQLQEEPKECMYATGNYTDEDRKVLCDGCEEECEYKHREESVNNGLDLGCGVIWKEEEPVSEDLEEAAKIYARGEYDRKNPSSLPWQCKGCYSPLIYAFKAGAKWHKEQMMKDAVDGGCFSYRNGYKHISCDIDENLTNIKLGDKVKLIIIKED